MCTRHVLHDICGTCDTWYASNTTGWRYSARMLICTSIGACHLVTWLTTPFKIAWIGPFKSPIATSTIYLNMKSGKFPYIRIQHIDLQVSKWRIRGRISPRMGQLNLLGGKGLSFINHEMVEGRGGVGFIDSLLKNEGAWRCMDVSKTFRYAFLPNIQLYMRIFHFEP